jgi:Protein of unknown function (DUF1616)
MYRRNLDIFVAGGTGLLGGAAYLAHVPGPVQVILGIALFFAPGYLWSEAILTQRLTGLERAMTSAGMALIFPILGGFLFYGLRIPLFRSAWVGLLVVLTLLGVVAVAIQRLRELPAADPRQDQDRARQAPGGRLSAVHVVIFGAAAVIALGSVAFSVKSANAQKYPGQGALSMTELPVPGAPSTTAPSPGATPNPSPTFDDPTQAVLRVANQQPVAEQYKLVLIKGTGKTKKTILSKTLTLSAGQAWQTTIAYTAVKYSLTADLYLLPDTIKVYEFVNNGVLGHA